MQSTQSFTSNSAHSALSRSRSLSTPVEVSQCAHQSQPGAGARSSRRRTAARSSGSPQECSIASNASRHRRAWSTSRSPNSPLLSTSPGLSLQRKLAAHHVVRQACPSRRTARTFRAWTSSQQHLPRRLEVLQKRVRPMRFRRLLEGPPHLAPHRHRPRQEAHRAGLEGARRRRAQKLARRRLERLQRDIHRLELRVAGAHHRAERHEPQVLVEFELARGAGDDRQVIALLDAVLPQQRQDALQHLRAAVFLLDGQQPDFAECCARPAGTNPAAPASGRARRAGCPAPPACPPASARTGRSGRCSPRGTCPPAGASARRGAARSPG